MTARAAARWSCLLWLVVAGRPLAHGFERADETSLTAQRDAAIEQVKRIVNQPVTALPIPPEARVGTFSPGWFHHGATRPAFLTVDVRTSQQFPYDRWEFVTSDLNPGLMFRGSDLEFNSNTKYFYTDYSLPKKRLSADEMTEINRLYRVIGERERDLAPLRGEPAPPSPANTVEAPAIDRKPAAAYVAGGLLLATLAVFLYRMFASRS
jgi:hypothetical protein